MNGVIVTGGSGLLGQHLLASDDFRDALGTTLTRPSPTLKTVDLTNGHDTRDFLFQQKPNVIIHSAALADADACEAEPFTAYQKNVYTTQIIADWIRYESPQTQLVYISTDQVYDGFGPHFESCPQPRNVYTLTKLFGETVASSVPYSTILRTNFFGEGLGVRDSFCDWIIKSLNEGKRISVFGDVLFSPIEVHLLVRFIARAIRDKIKGIYNLGSSGQGISKADFAKLIAQKLKKDQGLLNVISVSSVSLKAYRPKDMRMRIDKFEDALGCRLPSIEEGIDLFLSRTARCNF